MRITLQALLILLGVSAVLIALSILVLGATATATVGEQSFDLIAGTPKVFSPPWPPTMDNELRFYAAFWGAFGILVLLTAKKLHLYFDRIPWFAAVLFAGGAGRAISWARVGAPHPFFLSLMVVELLLSPVLVLLWQSLPRPIIESG